MPNVSVRTTAGIVSTLSALGVGIATTVVGGEKVYNATTSALSFFSSLANAMFSYPPTNLDKVPLVESIKTALELLHVLPEDDSLLVPGFNITVTSILGEEAVATMQTIPSQLALLISWLIRLHSIELTLISAGLFGTWTYMGYKNQQFQRQIEALQEQVHPGHPMASLSSA